uniref:gamma-aminobutyric acid receptor subunit rho-1-like n=1 Tax=Ciona intestinalis TaxID=7719 RepID=UPI000EF4D862|nr:gamma-aminobutyric acid receptor subunit rho-1-like [Ciona intestinalis]|eukprot:XP_002126566.2 gamma-aminobutyric acid receptor subunit rho-1-like [Ciona intestinalis]
MRLYSDGTIFYIVKITSTVACQMNLHNFPLDVEKCSLRLQSLGYTSDELTLEWSVGNHMEDLFMDTRLVKNMPKFQLVHYTFHSTQYNYDDRDKIERVSGGKSQLKVSFELKRYLLSVFFQSYFPALIMVVLAGLGMWIDPRSVPARISLGVTSVLTISTVITGLKTSLPKVSYLTAMDVYLWTCFIFVFSTVLEFCVVNYLMTEKGKKFLEKMQSRKEIRSRNRQIRKAYSKRRTEANRWRNMTVIKSRQQDNELDLYTNHDPTPLHTYKNSAQPKEHHVQYIQKKLKTGYFCTETLCFPTSASMDVKFRIGYFLTFILFNGVYWTYYVLATKHADESEV